VLGLRRDVLIGGRLASLDENHLNIESCGGSNSLRPGPLFGQRSNPRPQVRRVGRTPLAQERWDQHISVPTLDQASKNRLNDERLSCANTAAGWTFITISFGSLTTVTVGAIPFSIGAGALALRFESRKNACDHALSDPPRDDYQTRTRPRVRRFDLSAFPDVPDIGPAAEDACLALLYGDSYLSAMVRADERVLGALEDGAIADARERWSEARRLAEQFAIHEQETANALKALADSTAKVDLLRDAGLTQRGLGLLSQTPSAPLIDVFPTPVRQALERISVVEGIFLEPASQTLERVSENPDLMTEPRRFTEATVRRTAQAAASAASMIIERPPPKDLPTP
jgi:hypothetical protein